MSLRRPNVFSFHIAFVLFLTIIIFVPVVWAQDEGDEFFDDDAYTEQVEEEGNIELPRPGEDMGDPSAPPSASPAQRMGRPAPQMRIPPKVSNSGGSSYRPPLAEGEVEFRLVDPPKYWKPKKRKQRKF